MTKVVDKDQYGNPMNEVMATRAKNPIAFEKLLHYYHSIGLFKMDDKGSPTPDFSVIKAGAKTSAIDELSSVLSKNQPISAGAPA